MNAEKTCTKCGKILPVEGFSKKESRCKPCVAEFFRVSRLGPDGDVYRSRDRARYVSNIDKRKRNAKDSFDRRVEAARKIGFFKCIRCGAKCDTKHIRKFRCQSCAATEGSAYYQSNKDKMRNYAKRWASKNKDKVRCMGNRYRAENSEKITKRASRWKALRRKNSPEFRMICNLRSRLCSYIKSRGASKRCGTMEMVGICKDQLRHHIENQFTEGMSWDNYGKWHIDHIKPLRLCDPNNIASLSQFMHYTNLRPLWAKENISRNSPSHELFDK